MRPWPIALLCITASLGAAALPLRIALAVEAVTIAAAAFALAGAVMQTVLCGLCAFLTVALIRAVLQNRRREAVLFERTRLAREIHDVLAHALAALQIQIQLAQRLAPREGKLRETLVLTERLARDGADEVRRAVASLRGEDMGPTAIPKLIENFRTASGITCEFHVEGAPYQLSAESKLTLYRTAQEGLTNAVKHGTAPISVLLHYGKQQVCLRIENAISAGSLSIDGYGLTGIRERAELIGGVLETAVGSTRFSLSLRFPR